MHEHDKSSRGKSVESVPAPSMREKCAAALNELIAMCMDGGMTTFEIADVLEAEIPKLRRPFQSPDDNEAEATCSA